MVDFEKSPPPRPPPPVVGKVTHYSIEVYWDDALARLQEVTQGNGGRIRVVLQEQTPNSAEWGNVYTGFGKRHVIESLEPEKKYSYRMCFKNDFGASEWSQPVVIQTTKEPVTGEHLHKAIRRNDPIELRKILEAGSANVEATDQLGFTPLMQAAQKGFVEMMEMLLQFGADVNSATDANKTALMLAAFANQAESCSFLLEHGAHLNAQDKSGSTALHAAVDGQALDTVTLLLREGADVNAKDFGSKWTPLTRCAATNGNPNVTKILLKAGANVDVRDSDGKTALMVACVNGHHALVEMLLESGADIGVKNEFGKTAYDFATSMERRRVAKLIEEFAERKGMKLAPGPK